jgi:hypothetical protein
MSGSEGQKISSLKRLFDDRVAKRRTHGVRRKHSDVGHDRDQHVLLLVEGLEKMRHGKPLISLAVLSEDQVEKLDALQD